MNNTKIFSYRNSGSFKFLTTSLILILFLLLLTVIYYLNITKKITYQAEIEMRYLTFYYLLGFTLVIILLTFLFALYYFLLSMNKNLTIETGCERFFYEDKKHKIEFTTQDIKRCEYLTSWDYPITWTCGFKFLSIRLTNGNTIVLTELMGNLETIIKEMNIECDRTKVMYPVLFQLTCSW